MYKCQDNTMAMCFRNQPGWPSRHEPMNKCFTRTDGSIPSSIRCSCSNHPKASFGRTKISPISIGSFNRSISSPVCLVPVTSEKCFIKTSVKTKGPVLPITSAKVIRSPSPFD